jgi:hypothetical protein
LLIGGIEFIPERLGNNAEHGATIEFKKAGIEGLERHKQVF